MSAIFFVFAGYFQKNKNTRKLAFPKGSLENFQLVISYRVFSMFQHKYTILIDFDHNSKETRHNNFIVSHR